MAARCGHRRLRVPASLNEQVRAGSGSCGEAHLLSLPLARQALGHERHFAGGVPMATKQTVRRDSGSGQFITKKQADNQNPKTWEKEQIRRPSK